MSSNAALRVLVRPFVPAEPSTLRITTTPAPSVRRVRRVIDNGSARTLVEDRRGDAQPPTWRVASHAGATFMVIIAAGLFSIATLPGLFGFDPVVVTSGSMNPAIRTADVVITAPSDGVDLAVGTVIDHQTGDHTTLHRIVAVTEDGYRTAGDANRTADSDLVSAGEVQGVGVVVVPFVGRPYLWFQSGQWLHLSVALIIATGMIRVSRSSWLRAGRAS